MGPTICYKDYHFLKWTSFYVLGSFRIKTGLEKSRLLDHSFLACLKWQNWFSGMEAQNFLFWAPIIDCSDASVNSRKIYELLNQMKIDFVSEIHVKSIDKSPSLKTIRIRKVPLSCSFHKIDYQQMIVTCFAICGQNKAAKALRRNQRRKWLSHTFVATITFCNSVG